METVHSSASTCASVSFLWFTQEHKDSSVSASVASVNQSLHNLTSFISSLE